MMFSKTIYLSVGLLASSAAALAAHEQPNIIIFFADDLGYNDLGCRNDKFATPNIDRFATQATEFVNAYVPSPTSSPSRAGLLTGRHPLKVGIVRHISLSEEKTGTQGEFGINKDDPGRIPSRFFMPLSEVTFAEILRDAGYHTSIIGKWHLGSQKYFPDKQGFDQMFGVTDLGQPVNYYPEYFSQPGNGRQGEYLNDYLTNCAVNTIQEHDYKKPLLLYFSHYAVHSPHIGKTDRTQYYINQGYDKQYSNYLSMVESLDESMGRVCHAITERGIEQNTIVIFISDQGGYFSNAPLKGGKMNAEALYEGGARVPMMIRYGNRTRATKITTPVSTLDIFPTLLDVAGVRYANRKSLDGVSLYGLMFEDKTLKARPLYFYRSYDDRYASIIEDGVKYIATRSGNDQMYDLGNDPYEQINLLTKSNNDSRSKKLRTKLASMVNKHEPKLINCK